MGNKELLEVLSHFSIEKTSYEFRRLSQGFINDAFAVLDGGTPLYVLQRVNTTVFANVEGVMGNLQLALQYLRDKDYYPIDLIQAKNGQSYFKDDSEQCWRLITYVKESIAYDFTTDPKIAFEAGKIVGKFHELLGEAEVADFVDIIPKFHDLSSREAQYYDALEKASALRKNKAANAMDFVTKNLQALGTSKFGGLPLRVCHNDTKLNNIRFAKQSSEALCIIDLDTLMEGYLHYDFGEAIRTVVSTAAEDEQDHGKIKFERELFKAFVEGFMIHKRCFEQTEIEALPYGVILMPFINGLRALTDYLNGDIYYRVSYEEQNLDRALSLFNFTQKAIIEIDYMSEIVTTTFVDSSPR